MQYYLTIQNNIVTSRGQCPIQGDNIICLEVSGEIYNNWKSYIWDGEKLIKDPEYDKKQAQKRQQEFFKDFFKVTLSSQFTQKGYGYYRKIPKGYSSAIESIMTAERICSKMQGLPANTLIFYEEPDFYDEIQCTEEWLSSHQIILPALTIEQFDSIFITFIQSWNTQEHSTSEVETNVGDDN